MLVEADERYAAFGLGEMEGIGKMHPPRHPIQRFGNRGRTFRADARKSGKGRQSSNDLILLKR